MNNIKAWTPEVQSTYYFINDQNLIGYRIFLNTNTDIVCMSRGNMFPNEDIAEEYLKYITSKDIIEKNIRLQLDFIEKYNRSVK